MHPSYCKDTPKNKVLLWLYRRFNGFAQWILRRCDHYDCKTCKWSDNYGCMRVWSSGDICEYEPLEVEQQ